MRQALIVPIVLWTAFVLFLPMTALPASSGDRPTVYSVGAASIELRTDSTCRAKSLAISDAAGNDPIILIAVENMALSTSVCDEVAGRLTAKAGLKRECFAVTTTLGKANDTDERKSAPLNAATLTDQLEQLVTAALANRQPSRLSWGIGRQSPSVDLLQADGALDQDLPVLVVKDLNGRVRCIYLNAAGPANGAVEKERGDWTAAVQGAIQREFPSTVMLISTASNSLHPLDATDADAVRQRALAIAAEVKRLLHAFLAPINGPITARRDSVSLEGVPATAIQSWSFGESLAFAFLPGMIPSELSGRLNQELDGQRLWINGASNGDSSTFSSRAGVDQKSASPNSAESRLIRVLHEQLGSRFTATFDAKKTQGTMPMSPAQSAATMQTTPNLAVDLVCSEPLIASPVAIDFGPEGHMWVAEMREYPASNPASSDPSNPNQKAPLGGTIRIVRDTDGDGQYDASTIFLSGINQPSGVTAWRNGVLICAAPDILFAEDTDGDDQADVVRKLYSGFGNSNIQSRVNSLTIGLDGWVYAACSNGGTISNFNGQKFELGNRDFRIKPDTGELEPAVGRTQQGRARDDFGNWFGCHNLSLGFYYPLAEQYLRRNPYLISPPARVNLEHGDAATHLNVAKLDAIRFPLSGEPGTVTAACGITAYRDSRMGDEYAQNLFVCEPVNLVVHRMVLKQNGSSFVAERAANEANTEFLRSTDGWFRPVQAVTGPDGNLWIVDMYRFVIENPRWIPAEELADLDIRAGTLLGRIYRVRNRSDHRPPAARPVTLGKGAAESEETAAIYQEMQLQRLADKATASSASIDEPTPPDLQKGAPRLRLMHYRRLAAAGRLNADQIRAALEDSDPGVRRYALTQSEQLLSKGPLALYVQRTSTDEDPHVRLQAACSLGCWDDPAIGPTLAKMALHDANDAYLVAAVFSSVNQKNLPEFSMELFAALAGKQPPPSLMSSFLATAVGYGDVNAIQMALDLVAAKKDETPQAWQLDAITSLVKSLSHRQSELRIGGEVQSTIDRMREKSRAIATSETVTDELRLAAIRLLGKEPSQRKTDLDLLSQLLSAQHSPAIQVAAVEVLGEMSGDEIPPLYAVNWNKLSPAAQRRVMDALLSRGPWIQQLLAFISRNEIPTSALTAPQRQELIGHPIAAIREPAIAALAANINQNRQQVVQQYHSALLLPGDVERGRGLFVKTCSQCHRLGSVGHAVGPDLAMATGKPAAFFVQEILDPNRVVDPRFVTFVAVTKDGLSRTGIMSSESDTSLTLLGAEAKQFSLLRSELDELNATGKSLMPEGFEKDLAPQALADLIAFLKSGTGRAKDARVPSEVTAKQVALLADAQSTEASNETAALARSILDTKRTDEERQQVIAKHPELASELVAAMTKDLTDDLKEEYVRIPWIWRVSIACGRRNDADQMLKLLEVSLPKADQKLRDWQAVVIGGGVINGITQQGNWPKPRLEELLKERSALAARWKAALTQASVMADDTKVLEGTRYDALRMIALDDWKLRRDQIVKYLPKGTHDELQMGAISSLGDVDIDEVPKLLIAHIGDFNERNRRIALNALIRNEYRREKLLDAIDQGIVSPSWLNDAQKKTLRESTSEPLRQRAAKLFAQ